MNENTKKTESRIKKAFEHIGQATKRFWNTLVKAIRGREKPLKKNTGWLRRTAIGATGIISLTMFLAFVGPGVAWALARLSQEAILINADEHADKVTEQKTKKAAEKAEAKKEDK